MRHFFIRKRYHIFNNTNRDTFARIMFVCTFFLHRSHLRYFDQPKLTDSCRVSCVRESSESKEPFFLDEAKHRSALGK